MNICYILQSSIKKNTGLFIFMIFLTILAIVFGVIGAVNLNGGILSIELNNIPYVRFLQRRGGLVTLIFTTFLAIGLFYSIMLLCCCKPYLCPISIIFYLYFVYSQATVFTSIILIYGFFNVLILLIVLLAYILLVAFILLFILLELFSVIGDSHYFNICFKPNYTCLTHYSVALILTIIIFSLLMFILKSFVILLVF